MNAPYYADDTVTVHHGDCLDVLAALPDNSVDAVCTDPPYGIRFMGQAWDGQDIESGVQLRRTQASMPEDGKAGRNGGYRSAAAEAGRYDLSVTANEAFQHWCQAWATECLRVLKPGGHLLAFGGTRTYHRLASGIEDAGFEIRDSAHWIYGSGFPKSLDVSKAIDKSRDDNGERRAVGAWLRAQREAAGLRQRDVAAYWPSATGGLTGCVANWEHGFNLPTWEQWQRLRELIGFGGDMDSEVWRLNGRKGTPGEAWRTANVLHTEDRFNEPSGIVNAGQGSREAVTRQIKAANTDAARQWEGWGTALKPAHEPIVVARKPLAGTVAANVQAYGTGAINIDACRVEHDADVNLAAVQRQQNRYDGDENWRLHPGHEQPMYAPAGRWPANVAFDDMAAAELDEQTPDEVSRFFPVFRYEAKADTTERPLVVNGVRHPTVKPVALMRWLVRLVTPPGGTVLEPFAGSGATVEACILERFRCIAVEREADYLPLIRQRINRHHDPGAYLESRGETEGTIFDLLDDGEAS